MSLCDPLEASLRQALAARLADALLAEILVTLDTREMEAAE
jgi:hypothetical protein